MTKYELYLCDITQDHKPIVCFDSNTPFHTVHVGERFDDHGWERLEGVGVIASTENPIRYCVHSIKHTVLKKNDQLIIQYWLNLAPFEGNASPAWC